MFFFFGKREVALWAADEKSLYRMLLNVQKWCDLIPFVRSRKVRENPSIQRLLNGSLFQGL